MKHLKKVDNVEKLGNMNKITVKKKKLVSTLRDNRKKHNEDFHEATVGYQEEMIEFLRGKLDSVTAGEKINLFDNYPKEPESHVESYDEVILMLEYGEDTELALESHDFKRYVLDKWEWKREFEVSNAGYLNKLRR